MRESAPDGPRRLDPAVLDSAVSLALTGRYGGARGSGWVSYDESPLLYLSRTGAGRSRKVGLGDAERVAQAALLVMPGVNDAVTGVELTRLRAGGAESDVIRSYYPCPGSRPLLLPRSVLAADRRVDRHRPRESRGATTRRCRCSGSVPECGRGSGASRPRSPTWRRRWHAARTADAGGSAGQGAGERSRPSRPAVGDRATAVLSRSTTIAIPWPTPMHMVARP